MSWRSETANITAGFEEWARVDRERRAFLRLGLEFAAESYQRLWDQLGQEPGDDESELVDVFDDRVDGLWPHDYDWMHLAGIVRDAVTSFEVYLDKACRVILLAHGVEPVRDPGWRDLKDIFRAVYVRIETGTVRRIRDMRHFLTHRRGELSTEQQREKFAASEDSAIPGYVVELSRELVVEILDQLAAEVRRIDAQAWEFSRGGQRSEALWSLIASHRTDS
jgi:hypothetical protein